MKKLVLIVCLFIIPLTLASDTQHRFKVYVGVDGDDDQIVSIIDSYIKRELRLIGDVDIVGGDDDWEYAIGFFAIALETEDGRKTGNYAIANYTGTRLPVRHYALSRGYKALPSVVNESIILGAAYYSKDSLHKYCIITVGSFDKNKLQPTRSILGR